jgi:hypothetical protein
LDANDEAPRRRKFSGFGQIASMPIRNLWSLQPGEGIVAEELLWKKVKETKKW